MAMIVGAVFIVLGLGIMVWGVFKLKPRKADELPNNGPEAER